MRQGSHPLRRISSLASSFRGRFGESDLGPVERRLAPSPDRSSQGALEPDFVNGMHAIQGSAFFANRRTRLAPAHRWPAVGRLGRPRRLLRTGSVDFQGGLRLIVCFESISERMSSTCRPQTPAGPGCVVDIKPVDLRLAEAKKMEHMCGRAEGIASSCRFSCGEASHDHRLRSGFAVAYLAWESFPFQGPIRLRHFLRPMGRRQAFLRTRGLDVDSLRPGLTQPIGQGLRPATTPRDSAHVPDPLRRRPIQGTASRTT